VTWQKGNKTFPTRFVR